MFKAPGDGQVKLGDIVPRSSSTIAAGDFQLFMIGTEREQTGTYQWKPYKKIGQTVVQPGWYHQETGGLSNDVVIAYGMGMMLRVNAEKDCTLTYAGEVVRSPVFVADCAGYYRCGNITPVTISITNLVPTATSLAAGDFQLFTYDKERVQEGTFQYKPYKKIGQTVVQAGWYNQETGEMEKNLTFKPGDGFLLRTSKAGTLAFPDPIQ